MDRLRSGKLRLQWRFAILQQHPDYLLEIAFQLGQRVALRMRPSESKLTMPREMQSAYRQN